jgi:hypothetical protein
MDVLHKGFDGLEVTFQGVASADFLEVCKVAKQQAQDEGRDAVAITWKGQTFQVARSAAKGFAYRVSTGPDGEEWFFQHVDKTDAWGIRVSCGSMALATRGYQGQRGRLFRLLSVFDAVWIDYAISRADVCVDIAAPDFEATPDQMVCKSWRMSVGEHFEVHRNGRRVTSITAGKMPGLQIQIYDKRREVIDRQKSWWWKLWGVDKETRVWRVEIRAGKGCLKDSYGVRSFEDLEGTIAQIVSDGLQKVRYLDDHQTDSNVTRQTVHALWDLVREQAAVLCEALEGQAAVASDVIEGYRDDLKERWHRLMGGLSAGYATILGLPPFGDPEEISADLVAGIGEWISHNPKRFQDALKRHKGRFVILEQPETVAA